MSNLISELEDKYYVLLKIKYWDHGEWLILQFLWNMPGNGGRL